jgi:hypothetical protein
VYVLVLWLHSEITETGFSTEPSTTTRSSVTHTPSDSETSNNLQTSSIANPYPATPTDTNAPNDNDASSEKQSHQVHATLIYSRTSIVRAA